MRKMILLGTLLLSVFYTFQILNAQSETDPAVPDEAGYCVFTGINSNLWYGNPKNIRGDVVTLQNFLFRYYNIWDEVGASGFFGKLTKSYVAKFQREHNLYPVTGGVGPLTRNKMNDLCKNHNGGGGIGGDGSGGGSPTNCKVWFDGCNICNRQNSSETFVCTEMDCSYMSIMDRKPYCREYFNNTGNQGLKPVVHEFSGPSTLNLNQKGTWTVKASISDNSQLQYSILWGDEFAPTVYSNTSNAMADVTKQQTTFEHVYTKAGTYTVVMRVRSQSGEVTTTTQTVSVIPNETIYCTEEWNPVCGQPETPKCPPFAVCSLALPRPKTYSNICHLNSEKATFLYYGSCR